MSMRTVATAGALALAMSSAAAGPVTASSTQDPRLPTVVNAPGTWSEQDNVSGPVSAVGIASRTTPDGVFGRQTSDALFATSALDGRSVWLSTPGFSLEQRGFVGGVAVSPDGRWIGWVRSAPTTDPDAYALEEQDSTQDPRIRGWSVLDTTTGDVRELNPDSQDDVGDPWADLAFSGDSRYLLTSFVAPADPSRLNRGHQFVAWDVTTGASTVLETPGHYWLPNIGSAPTGVVWSRRHQVVRADPATHTRTTTTLPRNVTMASWAPGDAAFAYIGSDRTSEGDESTLYVGPTPATATRAVDLPRTSPIGEFLAWRDATHVVLGNYRRAVYVVDITTGASETIDMAGSGDQINTPSLATALWSEPLRVPGAPVGTTDPRRPWRWAGLALAALLVVSRVVARRRTRVRRA